MEGIKGSPPPALHQAGIRRPAADEFARLFPGVRQISLGRRLHAEVVIAGCCGRIAEERKSWRRRRR